MRNFKMLLVIFILFITNVSISFSAVPMAETMHVTVLDFNSGKQIESANIDTSIENVYNISDVFLINELNQTLFFGINEGDNVYLTAYAEGYNLNEFSFNVTKEMEQTEGCVINHTFYLTPICGDGECRDEDNETLETCPEDCKESYLWKVLLGIGALIILVSLGFYIYHRKYYGY